MDRTTRLLTWAGRRGGLPIGGRWLLRRTTGYGQALTRRRAALSALDLADLTVPYGPASAAVGLGDFPLSLDGAAHEGARRRIATGLAGAGAAHRRGVATAEELAADTLARWRPNREVDVVADLVEPYLVRWADTWYGLPGESTDLLALSRSLTHAIFFAPEPIDAPGRAERLAVVARASTTRRRLAEFLPAAASGTLARSLLAVHDGDAEGAAADLIGLTVGPLALGSWAIANVVDHLLRRPGGFGGIDRLDAAHRAWTEGLGRRPPLPGVVRTNPTSRRIVGHVHDVVLPAGRVFVATECAMHLDGTGDPPLAFGSGAHACLGNDAMADLAAPLLLALASVRPQPVPGPEGDLRRDRSPDGAAARPFPVGLLVRPTRQR